MNAFHLIFINMEAASTQILPLGPFARAQCGIAAQTD
jgi:hypothetical protein